MPQIAGGSLFGLFPPSRGRGGQCKLLVAASATGCCSCYSRFVHTRQIITSSPARVANLFAGGAHMRVLRVLSLALLPAALAAQSAKGPTIDELISLKRAGGAEISPDGKLVAYTIRETNWDANTYETNIWVADAVTGANWR